MITEVKLPQDSLISQALPRVDYSDAFRRLVPPGGWLNAEAAARDLFSAVPKWVSGLMAMRDGVVKAFGLKTNPPLSLAARRTVSLEPGSSIGLFRVYENTATEIVMGQDDRHLNFRVSLMVDEQSVTLSTVVMFHNVYGRAYFLPVKFFHKRVVPAILIGIGEQVIHSVASTTP